MVEPKITKIECNKDNVRYKAEGEFGSYIFIPKGINDSNNIDIYLDNKKSRIPISAIKKAMSNEESNIDIQKYPDIPTIKEILDNDIDHIKDDFYSFPELLNYKDITDKEFNNFEEIGKSTLSSSGLWIGQGIRYIELEFDENMKELSSDFREKGKKVIKSAYFNKRDNDSLGEEKIEMSIKYYPDNRFVVLLDTDKIMEHFEENDKTHIFYGDIEIGIDDELEGIKRTFLFPFEIKLNNPAKDGSHQNTELISIDFGTSSTCVAENGGKDLVSFNDNPEGKDEDYENMTAIVMTNWGKVYNNWKKENNTMPHLKRFKKEEGRYINDANISNEWFDYGNNIKIELENDPSAKTMDALIQGLKSLPAKLEDSNEQKDSIKPFDDFKNLLYLTDKIEEENDETLNPIAFYGYLIGRSLNLQIKNKIYTNYHLTMPVNFNKYQKDRITESIEYGLKRAIPKPLQEKLEVTTHYEESVALLGAARKAKLIQAKRGEKPDLFAVFDFGGGTLDFAFGLYRRAFEEPELQVCDDEDNKYRFVIEIFKTDGMDIGGELLIESLSWKIYEHNQDKMKEHKIPILVPKHETPLRNYPANLLGDRHIDRVNLKSFNETFSRPFFINEGEIDRDKVSLFNINEDIAPVEINIPTDELNMDLDKKMSKVVNNFKKILETTFKEYEYRLKDLGYESFNIDDVKILQAGNTCKAKWVQEAFEEIFGDSANIDMIKEEDKLHITPKNAVAKGVLMLENVGVYNYSKKGSTGKNMPLDRYIWDIDDVEEEGADAEAIFSHGDNENSEYKIIGRKQKNMIKIYYSKVSTLEDEYDENLFCHNIVIPNEVMENGKNDLWAKPYDRHYIECMFGNKKGENLNETKKFIIDLEKGEIILGEDMRKK